MEKWSKEASVSALGSCLLINTWSSLVSLTKSISKLNKLLQRCKVSKSQEFLFGVYTEKKMDHSDAIKVLVKICSQSLDQELPIKNLRTWLFLSSETGLLIWPSVISLRTGQSWETVSKMKCKSSLLDGVSGSKLAKSLMLRFPHIVFSPIYKLSLEKRADKMPRKSKEKLKILLRRRISLEELSMKKLDKRL